MNVLRAARQRIQRLYFVPLVAAVFVAGFALGNYHATSRAQGIFSAPPEAEEAFEPFWQVYNMIQNEYLDPADTATLVDGAITGMIDSLGDQFSGYMPPELYKILNDDFDGSVEGIGAVVHTIEATGEIEIVNVMEGAPAKKAGIQVGDIFYEVNGESVAGISQLELVGKVRGPAGSTVDLTMKRGEELVEFTIERARVEVPNIESEILDNNIAYIRLYEFNAEARNQIDGELAKVDVNARNGLIIDLRGNPGGLLSSVIDVTSAFVDDGVILVEEFGNDREQIFNANGTYAGITVPIVVLVDETSASASELFAGALQDHHIATIIGETTLGKGTVQTWSELVNGGGVRLTIARWLTPDRHWIHMLGVTPDIMVEWDPENADGTDDPQLAAALDYLESVVTEAAAD